MSFTHEIFYYYIQLFTIHFSKVTVINNKKIKVFMNNDINSAQGTNA